MSASASAAAEELLHEIHAAVEADRAGDDWGDDDGAGTPLETLIASLQEEVMRPSPEAPTHAGNRKAIAALLYSSHAPPDCAQFITSTDFSEEKDVGRARKQAFRMLMGHIVAYPADAKGHVDKLVDTCVVT